MSRLPVADHTFTIVFLTQTADCYAWLLPAEDQVWVMLRHKETSRTKLQAAFQENVESDYRPIILSRWADRKKQKEATAYKYHPIIIIVAHATWHGFWALQS